MNRYFHTRLLFFLTILTAGLSGCLKDDCETTRIFFRYDPVYTTEAEIREGIEVESPREMVNPGKIYFYNQYILVNEREEGIHVIDNRNPASPTPVSFISIPGNVDMAVRGNILYADKYIDLLAIDISDPANPRELSRTQEVFPNYGFDAGRGFITSYERSEVTREVPCNDGGMVFLDGGVFWARPEASAVDFANAAGDNRAAAANGVGGSLARFTLASNHLYVVDDHSLHVFTLTDPERPERITNVSFGWGIETIFPYGNHLFIGSRTGMYIFDNQNPQNPTMLSVFEHANACDPVYVDGDVAYVTLRDGTECETFTNQLEVVDISNLESPTLMHTYPMHHPIGLSVSEGYLYLCEDDQGVKVFDLADLAKIDENKVAHMKGFRAYDVITLGGQKLAMVIGEDGLYQFDISDPANPEEISLIPVMK